jgi:hypothetical protein
VSIDTTYSNPGDAIMKIKLSSLLDIEMLFSRPVARKLSRSEATQCSSCPAVAVRPNK